MKGKNKKISEKMDQMDVLLSILDDLTKTSDGVAHEIMCVTTLLRGIKADIKDLLDS